MAWDLMHSMNIKEWTVFAREKQEEYRKNKTIEALGNSIEVDKFSRLPNFDIKLEPVEILPAIRHLRTLLYFNQIHPMSQQVVRNDHIIRIAISNGDIAFLNDNLKSLKESGKLDSLVKYALFSKKYDIAKLLLRDEDFLMIDYMVELILAGESKYVDDFGNDLERLSTAHNIVNVIKNPSNFKFYKGRGSDIILTQIAYRYEPNVVTEICKDFIEPEELDYYLILGAIRRAENIKGYKPDWNRFVRCENLFILLNITGNLEAFKVILERLNYSEYFIGNVLYYIDSNNPIFNYVVKEFPDFKCWDCYFSPFHDLKVWTYIVEHFTNDGLFNAYRLAEGDFQTYESVQIIYREMIKRRK